MGSHILKGMNAAVQDGADPDSISLDLGLTRRARSCLASTSPPKHAHKTRTGSLRSSLTERALSFAEAALGAVGFGEEPQLRSFGGAGGEAATLPKPASEKAFYQASDVARKLEQAVELIMILPWALRARQQ